MLDMISTMLAASDGAGITEKLQQTAEGLGTYFHIQAPLLIAQGINFVVVALALWFFALRPLLATVEERNRKIREGLQYAEEMKDRLADAERQSEQKIREAVEQAGKIVAEANANAKVFAETQMQGAIAKAEQVIENAHKAMELERKKLLEEVRSEVADLVVATTAKVLARELGGEEKTRLAGAAAEELAGSVAR